MSSYQPKPGDRIRYTRYNADGAVRCTHDGKVIIADELGYLLDLDDCGRRYVATAAEIARDGMTQKFERL